jgi:hypothetical protein
MDVIEDDVTAGQPLHRPVRAAAKCNFSEEFAELFPSSVFLGLMGLPWEELDTFMRLKDGILRPGTIDMDPLERMEIQKGIGQELYTYFDNILDERLANPRDDILTRFNTAEIEGKLGTRSRHLLPVLHRRSRHCHRLAVVLLRAPRPARRPPSPDRRSPGDHPERGGGAPSLGDAGAS